MYILAIETTGPYGSAALLDEEGRTLGYEASGSTMSHLKDLIPMIDRLLKKCGVSKKDIDIIAPSVGPGSFTGIRIGVSTARALCQALDVKAVPVPTLEAFLCKERAAAAKKDSQGGTGVCAIINARRGQVYGMIDGFMEPGPYMLTDVLQVYREKMLPEGRSIFFFGDGIDAYEKDIKEALGQPGENYRLAEVETRYQDAVSVGRWAAEHIRKAGGPGGCAVGYEKLLPVYMRRAEAEQKLESGELPICKGPKQE